MAGDGTRGVDRVGRLRVLRPAAGRHRCAGERRGRHHRRSHGVRSAVERR
ncbi:MAG: hypothetical protein F6K11_37110, partial [Leptolyngbya sp. SIO3F4]|nr:hypothetical protein [Leptolyngbya sp. SIO3F4]